MDRVNVMHTQIQILESVNQRERQRERELSPDGLARFASPESMCQSEEDGWNRSEHSDTVEEHEDIMRIGPQVSLTLLLAPFA